MDLLTNPISPEDLIIYNKDDTLCAGGFGLNTILASKNLPPIITFNKDKSNTSNDISNLYGDLAIPVGLIYIESNQQKKPEYETEDKGFSSDDMHEKLLSLLSPSSRINHNNKTRKKHKRTHTKTRKYIIK